MSLLKDLGKSLGDRLAGKVIGGVNVSGGVNVAGGTTIGTPPGAVNPMMIMAGVALLVILMFAGKRR